MLNRRIIFRIDDIGASSKQFEVYSKYFFGNFLFLKYLPMFAAWGPYPEITPQIWQKILKILEKLRIRMTVAVTASWVDKNGKMTPFSEKFPKQASILKKGSEQELIEIANHGLTHCVVGEHIPKPFSSNRNFHREFWNWIPKKTHYQNIEKSQQILQGYFGKVQTFVPPGYVWTTDTELAAAKFGLRYLCTNKSLIKTGSKSNDLVYISDSDGFVFHDRDIVKNGTTWFETRAKQFLQDGYEIQTCDGFTKKLKK